MITRLYYFQDGTEIKLSVYMSVSEIKSEEKIHGKLIYVSDGHSKVACDYE